MVVCGFRAGDFRWLSYHSPVIWLMTLWRLLLDHSCTVCDLQCQEKIASSSETVIRLRACGLRMSFRCLVVPRVQCMLGNRTVLDRLWKMHIHEKSGPDLEALHATQLHPPRMFALMGCKSVFRLLKIKHGISRSGWNPSRWRFAQTKRFCLTSHHANINHDTACLRSADLLTAATKYLWMTYVRL